MSASVSHRQQLIGQLYREHASWLVGWLQRNLGCPQRAADLGQDTFMRLLGRPDLARPERPRALLATIARGLLVDQFRRNALERAYLDALAAQPEAEQPGAEARLEILETLEAIDRLLDGLSARARAAFLYQRLDGLSHAQIAERLGVSQSRVRQYLTQALRQCYIAVYGLAE